MANRSRTSVPTGMPAVDCEELGPREQPHTLLRLALLLFTPGLGTSTAATSTTAAAVTFVAGITELRSIIAGRLGNDAITVEIESPRRTRHRALEMNRSVGVDWLNIDSGPA